MVALEGIDGAGKTTQARLLTDWLRGSGIAASVAKFSLFTSDGFRHYEDELLRLIDDVPTIGGSGLVAMIAMDLRISQRKCADAMADPSHVVVADRYLAGPRALLASVVPVPSLMAEFDRAVSVLPPSDAEVLLDLPFDVARSRKLEVEGPPTALEEEVLRQVHSHLRDEASRRGTVVVDATGDIPAVHEAIVSVIRRKLPVHGACETGPGVRRKGGEPY